jgi:hypothetical protein
MDEVFKSPTGRLDELAKREIRERLIRSDRRVLNTGSDFELGNEDGMEDERERTDGWLNGPITRITSDSKMH